MANDNDSLENVDENTRHLAKLFTDLSQDPKTRKDLLKLVKAKNPNVAIPELDVENSILAAQKPLLDKIAEMDKEKQDAAISGRIERARAKLEKDGHSSEDIAAIEKLMTEKQIPSHDSAAEFFKLQKAAATPTPTSLTRSGTNKLPIDKKAVKESGGIKNWAREEAHKAVDDVRSGRVKLH